MLDWRLTAGAVQMKVKCKFCSLANFGVYRNCSFELFYYLFVNKQPKSDTFFINLLWAFKKPEKLEQFFLIRLWNTDSCVSNCDPDYAFLSLWTDELANNFDLSHSWCKLYSVTLKIEKHLLQTKFICAYQLLFVKLKTRELCDNFNIIIGCFILLYHNYFINCLLNIKNGDFFSKLAIIDLRKS